MPLRRVSTDIEADEGQNKGRKKILLPDAQLTEETRTLRKHTKGGNE